MTTSFNALIYNDKIFFPSKKRLSQEADPAAAAAAAGADPSAAGAPGADAGQAKSDKDDDDNVVDAEFEESK